MEITRALYLWIYKLHKTVTACLKSIYISDNKSIKTKTRYNFKKLFFNYSFTFGIKLILVFKYNIKAKYICIVKFKLKITIYIELFISNSEKKNERRESINIIHKNPFPWELNFMITNQSWSIKHYVYSIVNKEYKIVIIQKHFQLTKLEKERKKLCLKTWHQWYIYTLKISNDLSGITCTVHDIVKLNNS